MKVKKETAKYIGDFVWFSSKNTKGKYASPVIALKYYIKYLSRKDECIYKYNLDLKKWEQRSEQLLTHNPKSRIASKIVFALSNDLLPIEGAELLKEFLTLTRILSIVQTKTVNIDGKKS